MELDSARRQDWVDEVTAVRAALQVTNREDKLRRSSELCSIYMTFRTRSYTANTIAWPGATRDVMPLSNDSTPSCRHMSAAILVMRWTADLPGSAGDFWRRVLMVSMGALENGPDEDDGCGRR